MEEAFAALPGVDHTQWRGIKWVRSCDSAALPQSFLVDASKKSRKELCVFRDVMERVGELEMQGNAAIRTHVGEHRHKLFKPDGCCYCAVHHCHCPMNAFAAFKASARAAGASDDAAGSAWWRCHDHASHDTLDDYLAKCMSKLQNDDVIEVTDAP
eukprot:6468289-Amphidinium_carterae.6